MPCVTLNVVRNVSLKVSLDVTLSVPLMVTTAPPRAALCGGPSFLAQLRWRRLCVAAGLLCALLGR